MTTNPRKGKTWIIAPITKPQLGPKKMGLLGKEYQLAPQTPIGPHMVATVKLILEDNQRLQEAIINLTK